ncbi:CaiB/BaiF CoA-transferase family protein [Variovorax sp. J22G21]|uniref:CaiB/BaiF CoA transferase family protein n=1 Tax=Variovorax fucosicus TaxID=3053517 RepID=UPI0025770DAB|nr:MULTISPECIES: CaiB/BaiF CoA-transferase family protein [unclassified Variovorax]MDM0039184.1 CaiB/BaiF CoA-transferase family protein [Variovorax sp. J22R193]MDM0063960.1 CaiB/BaiF CoA-transferase family protein [Variovorax sp. J22G21]
MTSSPESLASASTGAPLAGVRVLDLTRLLPGPLGTMHLADLGADVVKIEDTGAGDYASATVRALVNRNKRAIRIDLKHPEGVAALLRLCRDADVLVEGFRPGVMQRLGVGYEAVAAVNPRIVYCSISGFGQTGPLCDTPGHDVNYAALAGVADQIGNAAGPALSNLPVADLLGGTMTAVAGILAALFDAARSGRGRHVDIAMADGVLAHAVLPLAGLHQHGEVPRTGHGALTGALACYGFYRTADDRHVAVGALEAKFWDDLCRTLERPDLAPLHRSGDPATEERLRAELAAIFGAQPLAHWRSLFHDGVGCVTPVLRIDEALAHPHFRARGMRIAADDAALPQLGCAIKMTGFDPSTPRPAPRAGEHTEEILRAAGLDAPAVAALRAAGAVG